MFMLIFIVIVFRNVSYELRFRKSFWSFNCISMKFWVSTSKVANTSRIDNLSFHHSSLFFICLENPASSMGNMSYPLYFCKIIGAPSKKILLRLVSLGMIIILNGLFLVQYCWFYPSLFLFLKQTILINLNFKCN